jgi:DNA primase
VIEAARPLAHVLWMRETEAGSLDTPERRAAFEARLAQVVASIGDDSVRKHYRNEFSDRLWHLFGARERPKARPRSGAAPLRGGAPWGEGRRNLGRARNAFERARPQTRAPGIAEGPYVAASPQLAASPVHRGHAAAIPRREALILQAVINHPWLLHDHLEELAAVELRHSEAAKVKAALIDIFAHGSADGSAAGSALDADAMLAELGHRGLAEASARIQKAITTSSVWGSKAGAGPDDVVTTWKQLVALHHQRHSLVRELREAEHALGLETTEANYSWLQDVKARLSDLDGTEALIDGFGSSSGRSTRTL